jgi:undecaprenyl-diphosphatase
MVWVLVLLPTFYFLLYTMFMNMFDATILGIIEGLSEFLPISSTAHLILGAKMLHLEQSDFVKSFEIIIQLGAILSVVTLYFKSFFNINNLQKVIIGFIPTAVFGLLVYKRIKASLGDLSVVLWALFIGGIILIAFEYWNSKRKSSKELKMSIDQMSIKDCVSVGLFQCVAFIPGVSRSAATIIGGMSLGISRQTIAEYSFLLAVPTMAAASGLDVIKNREVIMNGGNFTLLAVGFLISFLVGLVAIKTFVSYLKKHDFKIFGYYRIIVAILFYLFII